MIRSTALALLFLLAPLAAQAQEWVEHKPAGAGYRIEFPGQPVLSSRDITTDVGAVKMHIAVVERGPSIAFVALHNSFPAGAVGEPQAALDRGRDRALATGRRTLLKEERITVSGAPALRLIVEDVNDSAILTILAVVSGDSLYQAIYVVPKGLQDSPEGRRFLSSFALVPR